MKKLLLLVVCFTLAGGSGFAQLEQGHIWKVGTDISHREYKERAIMTEKGMMYGVIGSYTYRNNVMLTAEGLYSLGQVDYSSTASGTMKDVDDYMLEFRGLVGYDFPLTEPGIGLASEEVEVFLTPYIGVGCRYLNDDMGGRNTSTNAGGYERESIYNYIPVGMECNIILNDGVSWRLTLEYDYLSSGTQKSNMSSVPGRYDIENDQDTGLGGRASVAFKKVGIKVGYSIEPFIRYWRINASSDTTDPGGTVWTEPRNTTEEIGVKVAIKF